MMPILLGKYYHIFNRGINSMPIFSEREDYIQFLNLFQKYIPKVADTFAYCLMKNHFHFLVRVKDTKEIEFLAKSKKYNPSRQLSHLFNAYAKWFNFKTGRTGPLFDLTFRRKVIDSELYFKQLVVYIHTNPVHHNIVSDPGMYPWSSYKAFLDGTNQIIFLADTIKWFGDLENFSFVHTQDQNYSNGIMDI
ncbi:MAG: hypothetical protein GXO83_00705 [Chlorobi bacterium]|nr:hypothetical protein [Chlorobiota bacterium]